MFVWKTESFVAETEDLKKNCYFQFYCTIIVLSLIYATSKTKNDGI